MNPLIIAAAAVGGLLFWNYTQKGYFWKTQSQRDKEDQAYREKWKAMREAGWSVQLPTERGEAARLRREKQ